MDGDKAVVKNEILLLPRIYTVIFKTNTKSMEELRTTLKACGTSASVDSNNRAKAKGYLHL